MNGLVAGCVDVCMYLYVCMWVGRGTYVCIWNYGMACVCVYAMWMGRFARYVDVCMCVCVCGRGGGERVSVWFSVCLMINST